MTAAKLFIDKQREWSFPRGEIYIDIEEINKIIGDNSDGLLALVPSLPDGGQGMINITTKLLELMQAHFEEKNTTTLQFSSSDLAFFIVRRFFEACEQINNPFTLLYKQNVRQERISENEEETRNENYSQEVREIDITKEPVFWGATSYDTIGNTTTDYGTTAITDTANYTTKLPGLIASAY